MRTNETSKEPLQLIVEKKLFQITRDTRDYASVPARDY